METTGVMQEIGDLLAQGNSSRQVIDMGYAPGTVYGVQRRLRKKTTNQEEDDPQLQQDAEPIPNDTALVDHITQRVEKLEQQMEAATPDKDDLENLISNYLSELNQQIDRLAIKLDGLLERCEQLATQSGEWVEVHNNLASIVSQNNQEINKGFVAQGDETKATKARLKELEGIIQHLGDKLQANVTLGSQLRAKLNTIDQRLPHLVTELHKAKNMAKRQPTGAVVSVRLTDNRDHHFKEYKSPEGLTRPQRHGRDLILGARWIDLAEPMD